MLLVWKEILFHLNRVDLQKLPLLMVTIIFTLYQANIYFRNMIVDKFLIYINIPPYFNAKIALKYGAHFPYQFQNWFEPLLHRWPYGYPCETYVYRVVQKYVNHYFSEIILLHVSNRMWIKTEVCPFLLKIWTGLGIVLIFSKMAKQCKLKSNLFPTNKNNKILQVVNIRFWVHA